MAGGKFVSSGIEGLDAILGGGFPAEQLYLIRGDSGVGKTTLGLQFLLEGAKNGETVLYLGTSETEPEIRKVAASHGWSLDAVRIHHHQTPQLGEEQTMLHPAELELPKTMEAILLIVDSINPSRVVLDSLAELRMLARSELWYRRQLMLLKNHFAHKDCTVMLIEIPHGDQMPLNSVVSGVIELERRTPAYGPDRRRLRVAKIRGQPFTTGYHDYKIRTGGLDVFPRLVAAEYRQNRLAERMSTGLPEMDAMFHGGPSRGDSLLLLGPSGTGKSLVATQIVAAAAERGERCAVYAFDERIQTMLDRAEGVGIPLGRHIEDGTIRIRQVDPAELTSGEFSHIVRKEVEANGVRVLVIDSLNGYDYAMPEQSTLTVHLHELSSFLNQSGVTPVFTMTQHGLVSERIEQPFDVSYVADTILVFRHFEHGGEVRKAISVYKHRSGSHETSIRELKITSEGLRVGDPLRQFHGILTGTPKFMGERLDDAH